MGSVDSLKSRTAFIRSFYERARDPFADRKRKINANEEPWKVEHDGVGEPPFLEEWIEDEESLDVLGQMAISMTAAALQLYVVAWVDQLRQRWGEDELEKAGANGPSNNSIRKVGWFRAYRGFFDDVLKIRWANGPVEPGVLEEIVLTRNTAQHPPDISFISMRQTEWHFENYPTSFFADKRELELFGELPADQQSYTMRPWRLAVTRENLVEALDLVDRFADYLAEAFAAWPNEEWKGSRPPKAKP